MLLVDSIFSIWARRSEYASAKYFINSNSSDTERAGNNISQMCRYFREVIFINNKDVVGSSHVNEGKERGKEFDGIHEDFEKRIILYTGYSTSVLKKIFKWMEEPAIFFLNSENSTKSLQEFRMIQDGFDKKCIIIVDNDVSSDIISDLKSDKKRVCDVSKLQDVMALYLA